jgi:site-specific DNA recombinase
MPAAVIYTRVSTEDQALKGYSLPEQLSECRKKAKQLGATELLEFSDDVSGEILDRPGLTAAREVIRTGGVQWFVCLAADRFARKLAHQLLIADEIRRRRVDLVFTQHGYDDTPEGKLFFSMYGAFAEFEKSKILERTARGRRGKLKTGRLAGNIDIYGYQFNTVTDLLDVLPDEAEWVRRMYTWFVHEGIGAYAIRDRLNDLRVRAPRGEQWNVATIKNILRNPTYIGKLALNRRIWTGYSLNKHRPEDERVKPSWRDQAEWVVIDVPSIIDEELFHQAQDALAKRRGIRQKEARVLSGLMICGLCGGRLHYKPHTKRKGGQYYYYVYCTNRFASYARGRNHPPDPCPLIMIPARRLEEHVYKEVESWLADQNALEEARAKYGAGRPVAEPLRDELNAVANQLKAAREEHGLLGQMVLRKMTTLDDAEPKMQELTRAIERLERRQAELQSRMLTARQPASAVTIESLRGELHEEMLDMPKERLHALIRVAVRRIVVKSGREEDWEIHPN